MFASAYRELVDTRPNEPVREMGVTQALFKAQVVIVLRSGSAEVIFGVIYQLGKRIRNQKRQSGGEAFLRAELQRLVIRISTLILRIMSPKFG